MVYIADLIQSFKITQARQGSCEDARDLIEALLLALQGQRELSEQLKGYFIVALEQILRGEKPDRALNLIKKQGGQKKDYPYKEIVFAIEEVKEKNKPCSNEQAIEKLYQEILWENNPFGVDLTYEVLKKIHRDYKDAVLSLK